MFHEIQNRIMSRLDTKIKLKLELLELRVSGPAGERNDVSNVVETRDKENQSFETKSETCMGDSTVSA
jgi:hypothetical protein